MSYKLKISLSLTVFICFIFSLLLSRGFPLSFTVSSVNTKTELPLIIIDAGHGGIDPGAISGEIFEKDINLEIAIKFRDFCQCFGYKTLMIRSEDVSIYDKSTDGIHNKKVSDLKNRVKTANSYDNAVLISIHQNMYGESKYSGTQVFYGKNENSKILAAFIQSTVVDYLQADNKRQIKKGNGLFILENTEIPAVMVECGFMSNQEELKKLTDKTYQKDFSCALLVGILKYIEEQNGYGRKT